jgi:hypothetical protein
LPSPLSRPSSAHTSWRSSTSVRRRPTGAEGRDGVGVGGRRADLCQRAGRDRRHAHRLEDVGRLPAEAR